MTVSWLQRSGWERRRGLACAGALGRFYLGCSISAPAPELGGLMQCHGFHAEAARVARDEMPWGRGEVCARSVCAWRSGMALGACMCARAACMRVRVPTCQ